MTENYLLTGNIGTTFYVSPEVLKNKNTRYSQVRNNIFIIIIILININNNIIICLYFYLFIFFL